LPRIAATLNKVLKSDSPAALLVRAMIVSGNRFPRPLS